MSVEANNFRLVNGKVVEIWNHRDDLGMREQLGAPIYAGSHRRKLCLLA